jgi:uncharacterized membrane protein YuzA (DUF378 family)
LDLTFGGLALVGVLIWSGVRILGIDLLWNVFGEIGIVTRFVYVLLSFFTLHEVVQVRATRQRGDIFFARAAYAQINTPRRGY